MRRNELKIGMQVRVVPVHTYNEDGSIKHHPEKRMVVRELHNKVVAGLSYTKTSKSIYGISYTVIQRLPKKYKIIRGTNF